MSITTRRIYFASLLLFFTLAAPLLIYYSRGWRFDIGTKKIVLTGTLSITTDPAGVSLSLDDKNIGRSPIKAMRVAPANYMVKFSKEGYFSREQPLDIEEGKAAVLNKVDLFKSESSRNRVLTGDISLFTESPDKKYRASILHTLSGDTLMIQKKPDTPFEPFGNFAPQSVSSIVWSPDAASLVIETKLDARREFSLATLASRQLQSILTTSDEKIQILWDQNDGSRLYVKNGDTISLFGTKSVYTLPGNTLSLLIQGKKGFFLVERDNKTIELITRGLNESVESETVIQDKLPLSREAALSAHRDYMIITDPTNNLLYVFRASISKPALFYQASSVTFAEWQFDQDALLFGNDHALHLLGQDGTDRVVVRYADIIHSPTWIYKKNLALLIHNGFVTVADLNYSPAVTLELFPFDAATISTDESGKYMFLVTPQEVTGIQISN